MADAMVTGRMSEEKKERGLRVLKRNSISASQAVNLMFDRLIKEGDVSFLGGAKKDVDETRWRSAANFVDSLSHKRVTRFDNMTKAEIKMERLKSRDPESRKKKAAHE